MKRTVLLHRGEDGFIVAEVPSLSGCISQGRTRDEALKNIQEAIALYEETLRERDEPVPEDNFEVVEVGTDVQASFNEREASLEDSLKKLNALARKNGLLNN